MSITKLTPLQQLIIRGLEWWQGRPLDDKEVSDIILGTEITGSVLKMIYEIAVSLKKHDQRNGTVRLSYRSQKYLPGP